MDISKINDVKELESLGFQEYQIIENAQRALEASRNNLRIINARIAEVRVQKDKSNETKSKAKNNKSSGVSNS